jgi:hypothetical protein
MRNLSVINLFCLRQIHGRYTIPTSFAVPFVHHQQHSTCFSVTSLSPQFLTRSTKLKYALCGTQHDCVFHHSRSDRASESECNAHYKTEKRGNIAKEKTENKHITGSLSERNMTAHWFHSICMSTFNKSVVD